MLSCPPLSIPNVSSRRLGSVNEEYFDQRSGKPSKPNSSRARVLLLKLSTWYVLLERALDMEGRALLVKMKKHHIVISCDPQVQFPYCTRTLH